MKKIFLTVLTIFAFVISNAQEKANHHTTRSNRTQGIMVKEDVSGKKINNKVMTKTGGRTAGRADFQNFTITKISSKGWIEVLSYSSSVKNSKEGVFNGISKDDFVKLPKNKKSWEDATRSAVKEASKAKGAKKQIYQINGDFYYYTKDVNKLNKAIKDYSLKENKKV